MPDNTPDPIPLWLATPVGWYRVTLLDTRGDFVTVGPVLPDPVGRIWPYTPTLSVLRDRAQWCSEAIPPGPPLGAKEWQEQQATIEHGSLRALDIHRAKGAARMAKHRAKRKRRTKAP